MYKVWADLYIAEYLCGREKPVESVLFRFEFFWGEKMVVDLGDRRV